VSAKFTIAIGATMDWYNPSSDIYKKSCRVINSIMPSCLRSLFDPEDFVMDAVMELLRDERSGSELLVVVAKRRMIDAAKSPRNRTMRLPGDPPARRAIGWQEALEEVADLDLRLILEKRLEGYGLAEVVVISGLTPRTIQRKIRRLKKTMKKLQ